MHLTVLLQHSENFGTGCSGSHGLQQGQDTVSCGTDFTAHEVTPVTESDWDETPPTREPYLGYIHFSVAKNGILQGGNAQIRIIIS